MTNNPIELAKQSVPFWIRDIKLYDGIEIHPVKNEFTPESDETWHEQCDPDEAELWSVFGHLIDGGLECFEDFPSETEAETFADKLRAAYPHLREEDDTQKADQGDLVGGEA